MASTTDVICSATSVIVSATIGNLIIADGKYSNESSAEPAETGIFTTENSMRPTHLLKKNKFLLALNNQF